MTSADLRAAWRGNYAGTERQLDRMSEVGSVVTAFNANIDAVLKVDGPSLELLAAEVELGADALDDAGDRRIRSPRDVVRGLCRCLAAGIAEEWLIEDEATYAWLRRRIGYDRLQMGGQGGIVANAMAVCGVRRVLAHCASLPADQARLFLDLPNLQSADEAGEVRAAHAIDRPDPPMIHWILEFAHGTRAQVAGRTVECPKSNRFIATYDPLNFRLHIDPGFARAAEAAAPDYVVLSGFHMLSEALPDGTLASDRVDESLRVVRSWKAANPACILHLEVASTQDLAVRRMVLERVASQVDSIGLNERELIDMLRAAGDDALAGRCEREPHAGALFDGLRRVFEATGCPRVQLHFYGLYVTVQRKGFRIDPEAARRGMQLAAVVAAGKAGTGAIESREALLWAAGREVGDAGLAELAGLASRIERGRNDLATTGVWRGPDIDVTAVPTILIPEPVTLVGMGDTISSVSLVGAR